MLNAAQQLVQAWIAVRIADQGKVRHGFVPRGTPPRLHWATDRAARKANARALQRSREADPSLALKGAVSAGPQNHVHPRRKRRAA